MNCLVTGGAGFIASNFLNIMVRKYPHYNWYNLDVLNYCSSLKNIDDDVSNSPNYKFIHGNLTSSDLLNYILRQYNIDVILHFAAQSHVDNSFNTSLQFTIDNVLGTHKLLEASRTYGKIKKFIHVSTDEVYGQSDLNGVNKDENTILCPTNPYAATKAATEMIVMSYYYSHNLPIIITRGNNVYGPRQYPEKLIPKFICLLNQNKKMTIHGAGKTLRSYLYVGDVVDAFDLILHQGVIGEKYNIGCHDEHYVIDIADNIREKLKPNVKLDECIEYVKDRNFNDIRYYISVDKLAQFGWRPKILFDDGLQKTIDWFNSIDINQHWNNVDI